MANVSMDLAELEKMKEIIAKQNEEILRLNADIEANKKSVILENRVYEAKLNTNALIMDFKKEIMLRANNMRGYRTDEAINIFLSCLRDYDINFYNYIDVSFRNSSKSFIGLDDISAEIRKEMDLKYQREIESAEGINKVKENDIKYLKTQIDELQDENAEIRKSVDVKVREKLLETLETHSKEKIKMQEDNYKEKADLELKVVNLNQKILLLEQQINSSDLSKRISELTQERDEVKDKFVELVKSIKEFNNRFWFNKLFSNIEFSDKLL